MKKILDTLFSDFKWYRDATVGDPGGWMKIIIHWSWGVDELRWIRLEGDKLWPEHEGITIEAIETYNWPEEKISSFIKELKTIGAEIKEY